ncbi:MAG: hypothetical protein FWD17_18485 [Polyangiaceae bacterium]|nr:hypothetical protein [Polyangiaceae bacterium]
MNHGNDPAHDADAPPRTSRTLDRRRNRSHDPLVALHYQLMQTRHEGQFDAVVVADVAGVVVAAAGAWATCEEIAAYAPFFVDGGRELDLARGTRVSAMQTEVDVQTVNVEGQTVLLCARGGRRDEGSLGRAAHGVARILEQASAHA